MTYDNKCAFEQINRNLDKLIVDVESIQHKTIEHKQIMIDLMFQRIEEIRKAAAFVLED